MRVDDGQLADAIHADKSETILAIVGVASKVHVISAQKGNRNSSIIMQRRFYSSACGKAALPHHGVAELSATINR
jgi:hypothetical protein